MASGPKSKHHRRVFVQRRACTLPVGYPQALNVHLRQCQPTAHRQSRAVFERRQQGGHDRDIAVRRLYQDLCLTGLQSQPL